MLGLITRRATLMAAGAALAARAARAEPASLPSAPSLLVAGPAGSRADQWASLIAEPLGRLMQVGALGRENVGGADGVTGANQFEARAVPDGATALLAPGDAMLAWLAGDSRVRFDAGLWLPLWGGTASAVVASRTKLQPGRKLRMPLANVAGPELAALVALQLMGIEVVPVRGEITDEMLRRGEIDLLFQDRTAIRTRAGLLAEWGWRPAFALGVVGTDGSLGRDLAYPDLPIATELVRPESVRAWPGLATALKASIVASTMDVALVLPQPSPATVVAWWRRSCDNLPGIPAIQAEAAKRLVRPLDSGAMAESLASIKVDTSALLDLRRWMADRYGWRPS